MEKFELSKKRTVSNTVVSTLDVYDSGWTYHLNWASYSMRLSFDIY